MQCKNCGYDMAQGATFCLRCGAKVNTESNFVKDDNNVSNNLNSLKSNPPKKNNIFKVAIVLAIIIILISALNGGDSTKKRMAGTWYSAAEPKSCIEIFRNNTAIIKSEKGDFYNYTYKYEDGAMTLIPEDFLNLYTVTFYIEVKGDTMYWTSNGETIELYKSQSKAERAYKKLYE